MLYFQFKDYDDFKRIFGMRETNDGRKVRQNRILLDFLRSKDMRYYLGEQLYAIISMPQLKKIVLKLMGCSYTEHGWKNANLMGLSFWTEDYKTDLLQGVCEDNTSNIGFVRVTNERGQLVKIKMGRLVKSIIKYNCPTLPESTQRWIEEQLTEDWKAYINANHCGYELCVNDNFSDIYDSDCCRGDFHSCMVDDGYHTFYSECVDAKAAYLVDKADEKIIVRAIIYTRVHEEGSDKIWRLCERQYCTDEDNSLKKLLVNMLIKGGYIDGYKQIGASCHDSRNCVDNDGKFYVPTIL